MLFKFSPVWNKINSMTKYPSIPTYHALGEKGKLKEEVLVPFENENIWVTEKLDGTNARIILDTRSGDFLIGSREELLYAKDDRIINPTLGIVETLLPIAQQLTAAQDDSDIIIYYGEVYGGNTTKAGKIYSQSQKTGFRLFDIATIQYNEYLKLLDMERAEIARWRDSGNQKFVLTSCLNIWADDLSGDNYLGSVPQKNITKEIPKNISDTYDWLNSLFDNCQSEAILDGKGGKAEGVVIRNDNRDKIAKIRFQDYERSLK